MIRALLLVAALGGCTAAARERVLDATLAVTTVEITCDVTQTMWASNNGAWDRVLEHDGQRWVLEEENPMLGHHPSSGHLAGAWAFGMLVNTAVHVAKPIPQWVRLAWAAAVIGVEGRQVITNSRWVPGVCGVWGAP